MACNKPVQSCEMMGWATCLSTYLSVSLCALCLCCLITLGLSLELHVQLSDGLATEEVFEDNERCNIKFKQGDTHY